MNFDLDTDERALQDGIRELCEGRAGVERLRKAGGVDRDLWRELAEAGVFSLRLPEDAGGLGLGMTHAAVVFEELGRALVPGPLVATYLAAGRVDGAADGSTVVGEVLAGRGGPDLLPHADEADLVVVVDDEGVWAADIATGAAVERSLDPLTPMRVVDSVERREQVAGADGAEAWRRAANVLRSALLLGIALRTTDLAVAYAKEREQFGRPIGSFQAVKHLCADMLVRAEVARAAVYAAACHLDDPDVADRAGDVAGSVDRAVDVAAVEAGEAARTNGKACIQVHGGMGFTWEVDAHLYLKRAAVLTAEQPAHVHLERIGAGL